MCVEDAAGESAGLEQGEAEQDGVPNDTPDGCDGVGCKRNALDEHRVNAYADHDEETLQAQSQQAAQVVLADLALLFAAECWERDGGQTHGQIDFHYAAIHDDENRYTENLHGKANEERLQVESQQLAQFQGHEGGLQGEQSGIVHRRVARDDAAGLGHHRLGQVKDGHGDVKGIGDEGDGHEGLEHPAEEGPGLEVGQIVVVDDHLDQLVAGHDGQEDARDRQDCRLGHPLDHLKDPGRKLGGGQADLLADLAHLLVDRIKHPGQVAHDPADQYLLEPLGDFLEYLVHGPPSLAQQREAGQQAHERREKLKERGCNRKDFHIRFLLWMKKSSCEADFAQLPARRGRISKPCTVGGSSRLWRWKGGRFTRLRRA